MNPLKKMLGYILILLVILQPPMAYANPTGKQSHEEALDLEMTILPMRLLPNISPEIEQLPLSQKSQNFLSHYNITRAMILETGASLPDFQELFITDSSWFWNLSRFVAINRAIPNILEAPFRGKKPYYPLGGMSPIRDPKKRVMPSFIEGFTGAFYENLERIFKLTILVFLIVDLQNASDVGSVASLLLGNEEHAVNHLISFFQTPAGHYVLPIGLGLPLVWGVTQGTLTAQGVKHDNTSYKFSSPLEEQLLDYNSSSRFKGIADHLEAQPQTFWTHYLRPSLMGFVPFKEDPIAEHMSEMVSVLRWNGAVTTEEGRDIFRAINAVSQQRGFVGLTASDKLLEILHGINFKDFKYLLELSTELTGEEKRRLLMYLEIRTKSLSALKEMSNLKSQWSNRLGAKDGIEKALKALYAKSLLWYAGQQRSWTDPGAWGTRGFMLGLKGVKTWLFVNFLTAIVEAISEFIKCPNSFQNLFQGNIGEPNGTPECLAENIKIYGTTFSGQSPGYLQEMIRHTDFSSEGYDLDLSNKVIDIDDFRTIMGYFKDTSVPIKSLDLTGTFSLSPDFWYEEIGSIISEHPELQNLNISQWFFTSADTCPNLLTPIINSLYNLRVFNISGDYPNTYTQESYAACTYGISKLVRKNPSLTSFDSSNTFIGWDFPSQQYLFESFSYTPGLQNMFLKSNDINFRNNTQAQDVANILKKLQQLRVFSFSPQEYWIDPQYLEILNSGLQSTQSTTIPMLFNPNNPMSIEAFVMNLPNKTTSVDLSNAFSLNMPPENIKYLFKRLYDRFPNITTFNLRNNNLGNQSAEFLTDLGQGISQFTLTALTLINNNFNKNTLSPLSPFLSTLSKLQILQLSGSDFSQAGDLSVLTNILPLLQNLIDLELNFSHIEDNGPENMILLAGVIDQLPNLQTLMLIENSIGKDSPQGLINIAQKVGAMPNLTTLLLRTNYIGKTGTDDEIALADAIGKNKNISIDYGLWTYNSIGSTGPNGIFAIANAIGSRKRLNQFMISNNPIGSTPDSLEAIEALADSLGKFSEIQLVDFTSTPLGLYGSTGHIALAQASKNWTQLQTLYMGSTNMGTTGTKAEVAWGEALPFMKNLTTISFSNDDMALHGEEGLEAFALGFSQSTAPYSSVHFYGNYFGQFPEAAEKFVNSLPWALPSLKSVELFGPNMTIPENTAEEVLSKQNRAPLMAACEQQACQGGTLQPVKPLEAALTLSTRKIVRKHENEDQNQDKTLYLEEVQFPRFWSRLTQKTREFANEAKECFQNSGKWIRNRCLYPLIDRMIDGAAQVVRECPTYFPRHPGGYWNQTRIRGERNVELNIPPPSSSLPTNSTFFLR